MLSIRKSISMIAFLALAGAILLPVQAQEKPSAETQPAQVSEKDLDLTRYMIDPVHSTLVFSLKRFEMTTFMGRFNKVEGMIHLDPENIENSRIRVEIPISSIDTNNEKRDQHLLSPDYFNVRQNPLAMFTSSKIEAVEGEEDTYKLTGELRIGQTKKEITTTFKYHGMYTGRDELKIVGSEASFTIDRTEFGIMGGQGLLGNEVTITVGIEAKEFDPRKIEKN